MISKKGSVFLKVFWCLALSFALFFGFCETIQKDVSDKLVRLHVIANSDSEIDQRVKLCVRDAILKEMNEEQKGKDITFLSVEENEEKLISAAENVLKENGCTYGCTLETGRFSFPVKSYESITLPAGKYDAVRVVLGDGKGENWWCVMFPPLCFSESTKGVLTKENETVLKGMVDERSYAAISDEVITLKPAFKAVELWQTFVGKVKEGQERRVVTVSLP